MRIVQHCREHLPDLVTGQLLGLPARMPAAGADADADVDAYGDVEISDCFSFPTARAEVAAAAAAAAAAASASSEDDVDGGAPLPPPPPEMIAAQRAAFQAEMMKCVQEVGGDDSPVGWYGCFYMGAFATEATVETQFRYQDAVPYSVLVVHDPLATAQRGVLGLSAHRISAVFMRELTDGRDVTREALARTGATFRDIFEEVPLAVVPGPLEDALLRTLAARGAVDPLGPVQRLGLASEAYMEKSVDLVVDGIDTLAQEQHKFQNYQRAAQLAAVQRAAWLQKRRAENALRRQNGQDPLPEEDPNNPLFRPVAEPPRLVSLLASAQLADRCRALNEFAGNAFSKLHLLGGLDAAGPEEPEAQ